LRSAFHLSQCLTKLYTNPHVAVYGRFDVVHVIPPNVSSEDYAPQLRQQCVVTVWYRTQVRTELAAAGPTQRRRRPLADEYKCKEQGRDHARAYGNARRVPRHSLRPHVEPDFESPTTRNAKQVQVIEVQAHQRHENITTWRKNEAQVASRPISNCPTETDFRTQTVCD